MTRIRSGGPAATGALQAAGLGTAPSASAVAQSAMTDLAGKIASSVGGAFGLTGSDSADQWQGNSNDPYDIEELVESLVSGVGGSASEAGELSRALHAFVQEGAALFAARPESKSLMFLSSVIGHDGSDKTVVLSLTAIAQHVDAATNLLRGAVR